MAYCIQLLLLSFLLSVSTGWSSTRHAPVKRISASYNAETDLLTIRWNAEKNAERFALELQDAGQNIISSSKTKKTSFKVKANLFSEGSIYSIRIQALATKQHKASKTKEKTFTFSTKVSTDAFFGKLPISNSGGRSGTLYLPKDYRLKAVPVMLLFHGSSIDGEDMAKVFKSLASKNDFIILAPDSVNTFGWELSSNPLQPTEDQRHIAAALDYLGTLPHLSISSFIVAGMSAGGAVAAYYGSTDTRFNAMAILHGGIDYSLLGTHRIPVWLSTGTEDTLRPPQELQGYALQLPQLGFSTVRYEQYEIGHGIAKQERIDLVAWWLEQ